MYPSHRQKALLEKSAIAFAIIVIIYLCILFPLVIGAQDPVCTTIPEPMCISAISTPAPAPTAVVPPRGNVHLPIVWK